MPSPFVDRMATIDEKGGHHVAIDMAEPPYKIVRVAEANPKPHNPALDLIVSILNIICDRMLFPLLRFFDLLEVITYIFLLAGTAALSGSGIAPKLFAISQLIDMSKLSSKLPKEIDIVDSSHHP